MFQTIPWSLVRRAHPVGRAPLKKFLLQIVLWIVLGCSAVHAQHFQRFELNPFAGYTVSGDVSILNPVNLQATYPYSNKKYLQLRNNNYGYHYALI